MVKQKLEPYFVYFAAAHQAKPKKTVEAEPVLLLAPNAEMAVRKARFKIRGIKRDQVLDVRIADFILLLLNLPRLDYL